MISSQININTDNCSSETDTQTRTCCHSLCNWSKHRGVTSQSKLCPKTKVLKPGTAHYSSLIKMYTHIKTSYLPMNQISVVW
jgi:hypothetical protein